MRIFVINLDRDVERMKFINEQAIKNEIKIERISGINGGDLTKDELRKSVNRFRWYCAVGRSPLIGEIGCALSHQNIYRMMVEQEVPIACILEDDIFILDGFKKKLQQFEEWIDPNQPIVVRLNFSGRGRDGDDCITENGVVKVSEGTAACSYVLTKAAARAIIEENYPLITPSDHWNRWVNLGIIELYNCDTKVCWHNNACSGFNSTIGGKNTTISFFNRFQSVVLRVVGKLIDKMYMIKSCK